MTQQKQEMYVYLYKAPWYQRNCVVVDTIQKTQCACFDDRVKIHNVFVSGFEMAIVASVNEPSQPAQANINILDIRNLDIPAKEIKLDPTYAASMGKPINGGDW